MTALAPPQNIQPSRLKLSPLGSLIIAIAAFSFAGVLLRLAQGAGVPSMVIAASRLLLSALIVTPLVLTRHRQELARLARREILLATGAGALAGIHFIALIISLEHTTILLNQVIINSGPIWVALMEYIFLKTRFAGSIYLSLGIALIGGLLIAISGFSAESAAHGGNIMLGNLLALVASVMGSTYLILGRSVRQKVSLLPYIWIVYGSGGLVALIVVILNGTPIFGYGLDGYFWILMVAIVPQLIGHSMFNFALGYMPATLVALSGQVISFTAGVLAFFLFNEAPTLLELIGSLIIVGGVILAIRAQSQPRSVK
ncbi:MAG: DMT family transporter [Anaerolineae bacterium]|nr:DMT family transporter [Anaerolineae bacterium]MDW8171342.1 DMT family transporter [Anaerolineae bacterium]